MFDLSLASPSWRYGAPSTKVRPHRRRGTCVDLQQATLSITTRDHQKNVDCQTGGGKNCTYPPTNRVARHYHNPSWSRPSSSAVGLYMEGPNKHHQSLLQTLLTKLRVSAAQVAETPWTEVDLSLTVHVIVRPLESPWQAFTTSEPAANGFSQS